MGDPSVQGEGTMGEVRSNEPPSSDDVGAAFEQAAFEQAAARPPGAAVASPEPPGGRSIGRGVVVEFVRLVIVALFAIGGWEVATNAGPRSTTKLALGIALGSMIGFVVGGVFGRRTAAAASEVEREFRRIPAPEILTGAVGFVLGLVPAALLSIPLFHLPAAAAFPTVALLYFVLAYLGYRIGRSKSEELLATFGVKARAAGTRPGEVSILDTSAVLDGRVLALARLGYLRGSLLVTRSVLAELQRVADSSDAARRARGRAGLDTLIALHRDPAVDLELIEERAGSAEDVDASLVRLARERGAALVTNDANLAKVAAALEVPVRSIHALAAALRPQVVAGERVQVPLTRKGREAGQAVGHLPDGTMVVVERAAERVGETVSVVVSNVIMSSTGQLVFAHSPGEDGADDSGAGS